MSFPLFHRFIEVFDEKLQQLFTGGIIDIHSEIWVKPENFKNYKHFYSHLEEPQILTLEHLEAGFVVWLISISFAVFSFMLEWLITFCEFLLIKFVIKLCFQLGIGGVSLRDNLLQVVRPEGRTNVGIAKPALRKHFHKTKSGTKNKNSSRDGKQR